MTRCPERPVVSGRTKADIGHKRPVLSGVLMHRTNRTVPRTRHDNRYEMERGGSKCCRYLRRSRVLNVVDKAIWRRLHKLEFELTAPPGDRDCGLSEKRCRPVTQSPLINSARVIPSMNGAIRHRVRGVGPKAKWNNG